MHLVDPNELPVGSKVTFVLKTVATPGFSRSDKVEVQSDDQTLHTTLGREQRQPGAAGLEHDAGQLRSAEELWAVGVRQTATARGRRERAPGDWIPLGTLVRVPVIASVKCARATRMRRPPQRQRLTRAANASDAPATTEASGPPPPVNDTTTPAANDPSAQCTLNGTLAVSDRFDLVRSAVHAQRFGAGWLHQSDAGGAAAQQRRAVPASARRSGDCQHDHGAGECCDVEQGQRAAA